MPLVYGSHPCLLQAMWESLLDARIRLQKSVTAANTLPSVCRLFIFFFFFILLILGCFQSSDLSQFAQIAECRQSLDKMLDEAFLLSDELFDLQEVPQLCCLVLVNYAHSDPEIIVHERIHRRVPAQTAKTGF